MTGAIKYIPLTFVSSAAEKERLIRNTMLFRHFASEADGNVTLSHYIESTQYGFNASAKDSGTHRFVRISDISNGEIEWDTVPFCECNDPETYLLEKDDIVIARTGGTTGKSFMVSTPPQGAIYAGYLIRLRANSDTNPVFLSAFLNSYLYWSQITSLNRDEFRPSVNAEKLKELRLPRFDRAVQDQISRLSNDPTDSPDASICGELDAALTKRNIHESIVAEIENQRSLLIKLKQAILQEAIQGKLTADWRATHPEEEPASQLLHRIQAEKARLIAAKKLRPEKPLPKITAAEVPFEIPEGWEWCRIDKIAIDVSYGTSQKAHVEAKGIPVLRMGNITSDGELCFSNLKYVSPTIKDLPRLYLESGDIVFNRTNSFELVGKSAVFRRPEPFTLASYLIRVRLFERLVPEYVAYFINSAVCRRSFIEPDVIQQNGQANFNGTKLKMIPIPLPPLAEQAAIVERVEALMTTCRALEAEIEQARRHADQLLQAVLKEAFAPATAAS